MLDVYLSRVSQSSKSSNNHILSQRVNFFTYFKLNTVIGFSSAALNSKETHQIFSWTFNSSRKGPDMKKHHKQMSKYIKVIVGIGSGIVACIVCVLWGYFSFVRRKKATSIDRGQKLANMDLESLLHHIPGRFKLDDLVVGTHNFREDRKFGQGGFGGVYRCNLVQTNEIVAVKRISEG